MAESKRMDVPLERLNLNAPFQRDVVRKHPIEREGYDEDMEGEIIVAVVNGVWYVVDGKQRVTQKLRAIERGEILSDSIRALVYLDATMDFAAEKFIQFDRGRKALSPWNKFAALRAGGDLNALHVDKSARKYGFTPSSGGRTDTLMAVGESLAVVKKYGPEVFDRVMGVCHELYPGVTPHARFIPGMAGALTTDDPSYRKILDRYGDEYVINRLRPRAGISYGNLQSYIVAAVNGDKSFAGKINDSEKVWRHGILLIIGKRHVKS